ncbi:hypothetical protein BR93DRAFT_332731 [Coniochaeta sp. PMI_546]|nr:hypothetical protein BR93DRAFT_332731 [Coniochaeta sp. PMI_546]
MKLISMANIEVLGWPSQQAKECLRRYLVALPVLRYLAVGWTGSWVGVFGSGAECASNSTFRAAESWFDSRAMQYWDCSVVYLCRLSELLKHFGPGTPTNHNRETLNSLARHQQTPIIVRAQETRTLVLTTPKSRSTPCTTLHDHRSPTTAARVFASRPFRVCVYASREVVVSYLKLSIPLSP